MVLKNLNCVHCTLHPSRGFIPDTNIKYAKKKSISAKYAKRVHISQKRAMKEFFLLPMILNEQARKQLDLSEEETEFLDEYQENHLEFKKRF